MAGTFFLKQLWRSIRPEGRREGAGGPGPAARTAAGPGLRARSALTTRKGRRARRPRRGPGAPAAGDGAAGPSSVPRPRGARSGPLGRAAALGGRGSVAAASPFSSPGRCSAASSSLAPRRRLSLRAPRAPPLHQGRADPQGPSRKVRGCCRLPQLLEIGRAHV